MTRSIIRYDRRDSEVTPPSIVHYDLSNMDIYALFEDQQWTYINTKYFQKYIEELVELGIRDFIRDYASATGGENGISVTIHRNGFLDTNYVMMIFPDSNFGDFGDIYISRAANAVTIYNSGESGLPFHFIILEKINQSL